MQRSRFEQLAAALGPNVEAAGCADPLDVVAVWRRETAEAALRFLDRIGPT